MNLLFVKVLAMKTKFTLVILTLFLFIFASYAQKVDPNRGNPKDSTIHVKDSLYIRDSTRVEKDSMEYRPKLRILPMDTLVSIGSAIDYKLQMLNDSSEWIDLDAKWSLKGSSIGSIDENGHLDVTASGIAYVVVFAEEGRIVARVVSREAVTVADSTGLNTISISRVFPDGKVLPPQVIKEGDSYKIGGLPAPLNLLNGAQIYFPVGSLHENIAIQIKLPEFVKVDRQKNVNFGGKILNAVSFDVYVNDVHIEPYNFDIPLNVILPFKRGVIRKMGLDISRLSLFYAKDSTELDSMGISNVMLDTITNQIYSQVAHFSSLALTEVSQYTSTKKIAELNQMIVYPNPANANLNIDFNGVKTESATIVITNILGQTVLTAKTTSNTVQLNTSGLSTGLYHLQVLDEQNKLIFVSKIMKK